MSSRYIVHVDDRVLEVGIAPIESGFRIELDGEILEVESRASGGGEVRSLLIDGRSYESATMPASNGIDVYVSGDVFHLRVTDELWARAEAAAHGAGSDLEEVVSPMPGAVVSILARDGQAVEPGETVAVIEAMKMQNDIAAIRGGTVREIRSKPGDVVNQGAVLLVLGPAEGSPE
jgi:acetyl/propionyl-CoA carboxylase alpha subunit